MSREAFQGKLDRLVAELTAFGGLVCEVLDNMDKAVKEWDVGIDEIEIGVSTSLRLHGESIDEECMILQVRQAPVARDLRLLYTIQAVTNHLVRISVLAEHVLKIVSETVREGRDEISGEVLTQMSRSAKDLVYYGLKVFEARDAIRARDLPAMDDKVDLLCIEAMSLIVNIPFQNAASIEWRVKAALITRYLERIADHGVEIGRSTLFLVTGKRIANAI